MPAGAKDFLIEQGNDFCPIIVLRDSTTQLPIDVTGWTFLMEARSGEVATDPLIFSITNGVAGTDAIVLTDPSNGEIQLSVIGASTELFTQAQFDINRYNLRATDVPGKARRLLEGVFVFSETVIA